jgi:prepilin-type N-terminal cleavage/methylation domain-containing protein
MKAHNAQRTSPGLAAFTLIELLVVIAVIGLLAGMVFPITAIVKKAQIMKRSQSQLADLETFINSYKLKLGHYPNDNPRNPVTNQLYYELAGTTLNQGVYTTLDGSAKIPEATVKAVFNVEGLVNCTRGGGGDEGGSAQNFMKGLKPDRVATLRDPADTKVLVGVPFQISATPPFNVEPLGNLNATINPWRYNCSSPTNNPNSYDLWLDVIISGKAYRICNWSKQPLRVTQ